MSALAIPIYNLLVARGISEKDAREAAEAAAAIGAESAAAEAVAKAVAHSEEKADAKFVSKDEYHQRDKTLATRADIADVRAEIHNVRAEIAAVNRRIDGLYRIAIAAMLAAMGTFAAAVAAAVKFIFFGI